VITEALIKGVAAALRGLASLLGFDMPDWSGPIAQYTVPGAQFLLGLHNWVALQAIAAVLTFLFAVWFATWGLRLVRIVASFFTGGGGGAA
jgi:hypothetical protein